MCLISIIKASILPALTLLFLRPATVPAATAGGPPPSFVKLANAMAAGATIWGRACGTMQDEDCGRTALNISRQLTQIANHGIFKNKLPKTWAILIDGTWTGAAGYWSPTLRAPDGAAAILLKPSAVSNSMDATRLLVHEMMHLVHGAFRPEEKSWVREGLALLSEYIVTGFFNPALHIGFKQPETSLTGATDPRLPEDSPDSNRAAEYGHQLQYFYYLYRLCGGQKFFDALAFSKSSSQGMNLLDEILGGLHRDGTAPDAACENFGRSFVSFEIARFAHNMSVPSQYVVLGATGAVVRDKPAAGIPEFSATAYRPEKTTHPPRCQRGDLAWNHDLCIRIRGD